MALNKINKGQTDWHIPLNENFEKIPEKGGGLQENLDAEFVGGVKPMNPQDGFASKKNYIPKIVPSNDTTENATTLEIGQQIHFRAFDAEGNPKDDGGSKLNFNHITKEFERHDIDSDVFHKMWDSGNFKVETGTWSPIIRGHLTAGSFKYGEYNKGYFLRIGNSVEVSCRMHINEVLALGAGEIYIGNLPFSAKYDSSTGNGYANGGKDEYLRRTSNIVINSGASTCALRASTVSNGQVWFSQGSDIKMAFPTVGVLNPQPNITFGLTYIID